MRKQGKKIDEWKRRLPNGKIVKVEVRLAGTEMFATCPGLEGFGRTDKTTDLDALGKLVDAKLKLAKPIEWKNKLIIEYDGSDVWADERGGTPVNIAKMAIHDCLPLRPTFDVTSVEQGEGEGIRYTRRGPTTVNDGWAQEGEGDTYGGRLVQVIDDTPENRKGLDGIYALLAAVDAALAAMLVARKLPETLKEAAGQPARLRMLFVANVQRSLDSVLVDVVGVKEARLVIARRKVNERRNKK